MCKILMLISFIDRAVYDDFLPTAAWSMTEAWLEFRNYSFTLRVPPSGQSADLSQAQFAAICIISAFLPFFPHTKKPEVWEPTWIHPVYIYNAAHTP